MYSTIADAWEACRQFTPDASIRIEAPITLNEEEFEVLADDHAHEALCVDWFLSVHYSTDAAWDHYYHHDRLNKLEHLLGHEAVHRIFDKTRKKAIWRADQATALTKRTDVRTVRKSSRQRRRAKRLANPRPKGRARRAAQTKAILNR